MITKTVKELADRIVALGVGKKCNKSYSIRSNQLPDDPVPVWTLRTSAGFVRDWRVAGALMEKFNPGKGDKDEQALIQAFTLGVDRTYRGDSLPYAIILACVEALEA